MNALQSALEIAIEAELEQSAHLELAAELHDVSLDLSHWAIDSDASWLAAAPIDREFGQDFEVGAPYVVQAVYWPVSRFSTTVSWRSSGRPTCSGTEACDATSTSSGTSRWA